MAIDISSTFRTLLSQSSDITNTVGTRIYSDMLPQSADEPAVVYWVITETVYADLHSAIGMDQATIQVDCLAKTRSEANALARAAWMQLDGFMGIVGTTLVKDISRDTGITHETNRVSAGSDQYRFVATQDFMVTYDSKCEHTGA